jgi:hypothetical protein
MSYRILMLLCLLLAARPAAAGEVRDLAGCTTRLFQEIGKNGKWTGKLPAGCSQATIEERPDGLFITAWLIEPVEGGWTRTSFSGAMGLAELASKQGRAAASRDIAARAGRLEQCLDSIVTVNDPLECRDRAVKTYQAGETSGTETTRLIWLDDNGRHAVVEYAFGTASATPAPPTELFSGTPVPPGVIVDLRRRR